jgi:hypothetical protein
MRSMPHPPAGRSGFIYIVPLLGSVKFIDVAATAFLLPIQAAVLAPQHRARIFEAFFTTKGDKGTGLGLWLCTGIVSRVGGSMRVWSTRRPGHSGTCFSVFLPAEEATFTPLRRRYER